MQAHLLAANRCFLRLPALFRPCSSVLLSPSHPILLRKEFRSLLNLSPSFRSLDVLRDTEDHDLALAISHFLNCLFGSCHAPGGKLTVNNTHSKTPKREHSGHQSSGKHSRGQARWKGKAFSRKSLAPYMNMSSETLWFDIQEFSMVKYKSELLEGARSQVKKISVLRNLCQKVGISIAARKYDLNSPTPFQTSDILDLRPVVKHSVPLCSEAKELVETGKLQLAEEHNFHIAVLISTL